MPGGSFFFLHLSLSLALTAQPSCQALGSSRDEEAQLAQVQSDAESSAQKAGRECQAGRALPALKMSSQQIVIFKQRYFGRTEGKKRQKHKLNLCSLMHPDKIFALLKMLQRELAAVPVCSCCQGFDVYLKSCFSLFGLCSAAAL